MALVRLIYVSSAVEELPDQVLDDILKSAVQHNKPQNITGMLLYCGGNFMQVLEGEEAAVKETYAPFITTSLAAFRIDARPGQALEMLQRFSRLQLR